MENLKNLTPTELLKLINDIKKEHENIKKYIIDKTYIIDEIEKEINEKIKQLETLEEKYVSIVEEIDNRE